MIGIGRFENGSQVVYLLQQDNNRKNFFSIKKLAECIIARIGGHMSIRKISDLYNTDVFPSVYPLHEEEKEQLSEYLTKRKLDVLL